MTSTSMYILYLVFALGAAGLYFVLPRTGPSKSVIGAIFGVSGLLGLFVVFGMQGSGQQSGSIYFYIFAAAAVLAAARVISHPKPVYSAIYFVAVVIAVAAMLVLQEAEFLAVALIIIYAGAILVTYLFVIMLAQQPGSPIYDRRTREPFLAVLIGIMLMAVITGRASHPPTRAMDSPSLADGVPAQATTELLPSGNTMALGAIVTTRYVVALELAGILLLISMVGAIALSRKRIATDVIRPTPPALGRIGKEVEPF